MLRRPVRRMGRPGLVGTVARTAVVAGTATAVAGGVSRHQQQKGQQQAEAQAYEQQQQQQQMQQEVAAQLAAQQPAPAAAAPAATDTITQLQQLAALKEQGILTEAEFAAQKAKILGT
jgi:Short C-terminal domain